MFCDFLIQPPPAIPTSFEPDYEMFKDCTCEGEVKKHQKVTKINVFSPNLEKMSVFFLYVYLNFKICKIQNLDRSPRWDGSDQRRLPTEEGLPWQGTF